MKYSTAKKRATSLPVNPPLLSEAEVRRAVQNAAKRDAVSILWHTREQLTPNSTAAQIVSRAMDHVMTPEEWS